MAAEGSQTLERGLMALRMIAEERDGLTASEVGARLGVHRSVAYRLLGALVRQGFAAKDDANRYRVGLAFFTLAELTRPPLLDAARPVLRDLAAELGVTACLVVPEGNDAVAVAVVEPPGSGARLSYRVGNRDPLDLGAGGLALLAALPPRPGEPGRVAEVRARGYALTCEELIPGVFGVASPVVRQAHEQPAAVTTLTHREDLARQAVPAVLAAAERLARALAAPGPRDH
ncbi:IclR family transcriptional regulator [Streptomyces chilikensis]|uniref:Helix-turn-helix domain-containing protein n=1 Tax=Streptomyces chilikensis TaxID=1194079 RepID=A0ABV3EKN4_9ACTN